MADGFFFYDLETSGFNPREARIMQFAGQRTDSDLQPVGEPVSLYIKLTPDILPEPDAVLLTAITPQQTITDGLSEAEFLKYFYEEIWQADTTFLGYNTIRFDDEFMRFLHYRNFYDPYEWQWNNNCSRWDILDLVRMVRALRPEGIKWPFTPEGRATNRLELVTKLNGLNHDQAHDALSDVQATIAVAQLMRHKQPKLFDYLYGLRHKSSVRLVVNNGKPFMYISGRYSSEYLHTTTAITLVEHSRQDSAIVYDLRQDPTPFLKMDVNQLVASWRFSKDPDHVRLPVKTLKYNRCPAVVAGVVQDQPTLERLQLTPAAIKHNMALLQAAQPSFAERLLQAAAQLDEERERTHPAVEVRPENVDGQLYAGFFDKADKETMRRLRTTLPEELLGLQSAFHDQRLRLMLPLYKARNYPSHLSAEEREAWDSFCAQKLPDERLDHYFKRLSELMQADPKNENKRYLLEELQLYGESIVPVDATG